MPLFPFIVMGAHRVLPAILTPWYEGRYQIFPVR
jgi:hypothetical protein